MPKSRDISEKKLVITLQDEDGNIISRLPTNVSASQLKIGHPLKTKQDLQKVADNLETAIGDVIEQLKAPLLSIILSNQPEKPEQTANAVKPAQSSADVKIKKLKVQTLYGETHANAKICIALKVNSNATARSLAVDKLLAEEQIEGLSYRGADKIIQQSNHLKIAPGTIHDYVSQTGAFIRKTADEERSAIFKASDYTEEGFLENIQESQQRLGIIKLKAYPLATELTKVLGMFNTKLEADWLQMPKAKRPLQPQRVSSIAFLPTLECWDGKLPLAYICVDEVMVKKQKTMRKRSRKPQHQDRRKRKLTPRDRLKQKNQAKAKLRKERQERSEFAQKCTVSYAEDRPGVSTTSITVKWDGKLQLLIAPSVKEGFKTLIAFLLHNGLINRHMVFFINGAGVLKTPIDKYFSYCNY